MEKKMGQLYRVPLDAEGAAKAVPGGFVFWGNYDDHVIGFINVIDRELEEMEICLFEPGVMPSNVIRIIREVVSRDESTEMLKEICEANPEVKAAWVEAVNGPTYESELPN